MNTDFYRFIESDVSDLQDTFRLRNLKPKWKQLIKLSSNDYLGLSYNEACLLAGIEAAKKWGNGGQASRLVYGNYPLIEELEQALADWLGYESSLCFASGYQLNLTVLGALGNKNTQFYADKFVHNSIITGISKSDASYYRFQHNKSEHLEQLLKKHRHETEYAWIVIESVYSMDGDSAPLEEIRALAQTYNCLLYVDEAHALGVFGEKGEGLFFPHQADVLVGTFGKSFGTNGAFLACSNTFKQWLINRCGGFIYSTALSPFLTGASLQALESIKNMNDEREKLRSWSVQLRKQLGDTTIQGESPIVPWIIGSEAATLKKAQELQNEGFGVIAIRPPTVQVGASRIRFTLNTSLQKEQFQQLMDFIKCQA